MPKSSVQGWQSADWDGYQIKHIGNHQDTVPAWISTSMPVWRLFRLIGICV
jgi:hypothetical protein